MARLATAGAEGNDITLEGFSAGGAVAPIVVTTPVRTGTYAYKCAGSSGVLSYLLSSTLSTTVGSRYIRAHIRFSALPANTIQIITDDVTIGVRLRSDGKLELFNRAGSAVLATGTTVLAANTYYRIELLAVIGAGAGDDGGTIRINGVEEVTSSGNTIGTTFGSLYAVGVFNDPGSTLDMFLDDIAINDAAGADQNSWPGEGKVVLLVPTSDSVRDALWTGGAGGTTNLFEAVNNKPSIGTATETDLTQIEHAGNADTADEDYDANLTTYSTAGVGASDTITLCQLVAAHGEDISTGAKLLAFEVLSNPVIASSGNVNAGTGALGTYPTGWNIHLGTVSYGPSVTLGTAPVMRVRRPETASRVASVCFMGLLVEYAPAVAGGQPARSLHQFRARSAA